jgi:hypothetical protein
VVLGIAYWGTVMILSGSFSPGEKPGPSTGKPRIADVKIQAALVGSGLTGWSAADALVRNTRRKYVRGRRLCKGFWTSDKTLFADGVTVKQDCFYHCRCRC